MARVSATRSAAVRSWITRYASLLEPSFASVVHDQSAIAAPRQLPPADATRLQNAVRAYRLNDAR